MSARSFLFVPGDRQDRLARCRERDADAVIVDLEDAVTPDRRDAALEIVATWLASQGPEGSEVWLRVSGATAAAHQLTAVPSETLAGVFVPKIHAASDLAVVPSVLPIVAFVETAPAMLDVAAIAACRSVTRLVIGEADLGADLGLDPRGSGPGWPPLRMQVVVASAAAGLEQPLGPVHPDFRDLDGFRAGTEELMMSGFGGRCCIHPDQVTVVNDVFTPSPAEVDAAEEIVSRYAEATSAGTGVIVGDDGTMLDEAYVRTAHRVLDRARRAGMMPA